MEDKKQPGGRAFRRVSSANHLCSTRLLDTDVLPVGQFSITCCATKLRYGSSLRAAVTYGDGRNEGHSRLNNFAGTE